MGRGQRAQRYQPPTSAYTLRYSTSFPTNIDLLIPSVRNWSRTLGWQLRWAPTTAWPSASAVWWRLFSDSCRTVNDKQILVKPTWRLKKTRNSNRRSPILCEVFLQVVPSHRPHLFPTHNRRHQQLQPLPWEDQFSPDQLPSLSDNNAITLIQGAPDRNRILVEVPFLANWILVEVPFLAGTVP
jgi:hypothetical protein